MSEALNKTIQKAGLEVQLVEACKDLDKPLEEVKELMAYKERVMLSHCRAK